MAEKMNWYQKGTEDVFELLSSSAVGLTGAEAETRLLKHGPNKLAEEERISRMQIIIHQFTSPLIYILMIAAVVTGFLEEYIDTGVILAVIIVNAIIGYVQEYKAEESVRALKKMVVPRARVLRDGHELEIKSEELVPGDVVLLASGTKVPADLRLYRALELKVDEAMLTGESIPAEKLTNAIREENLSPGDQRNMAFMGTVVVSGRAHGFVVETGEKTVLGRIAEKVRSVEAIKTPLQVKLERFAKIIGLSVFVLSLLVFLFGVMLGASVQEMFLTAVATAVSAIPEGLPVAVTIVMAIGVARMARRNAIMRQLPAVETLGSTTVIGSDKTGTLTKNEMTVKLILAAGHTFEVKGSGYEPKGEIVHEQMPLDTIETKHLTKVLRIGLLCNESHVYSDEDEYKVDGDPTEGALIVSAMKGGLEEQEERKQYPQIAIIPFESERGFMATMHSHRGKKFVFLKGAPERLLDMCSTDQGGEKLDREQILGAAQTFAKEGLRVLAMACKEVPKEMEDLTAADLGENFSFAGLQGMIDPPRPEVIAAIEGCKKAGIRTVMITGDHAVTAVAIAKKLGIGGEDPTALTGKEIETMNDGSLFKKVNDVSVYARVSPQHKLRIVQQLQKHGEVVAVTGDGVNDAPALKAAHIGISMGRTGTDVAKEASDMVLADDNFNSIFAAVEEGRVVYENIKKVTIFLVSCGFGEILAILATILMGLPIPYIPAQILWLNLVTNGLQDVALAFEPGEKNVLNRRPRKQTEGILSRLMIERTILMGLILAAGTVFMFVYELKQGASLERARTIALTTMVFFQFYQAFNCRSETQSIFRMNPLSNPFLFFSMVAAFFAQLAVLYVPALQWVFRTVPLGFEDWVLIGLVSVTIVIAVELDKLLRRRKEAFA